MARSLLEDAARSERVFATPIDELLRDIYGDPRSGYRVAVESLVESGHYLEAAEILERSDADGNGCSAGRSRFAHGMARYYAGNLQHSLELLESWIESGADGNPAWRERAANVLRSIAREADESSPLGDRAGKAIAALTARRE